MATVEQQLREVKDEVKGLHTKLESKADQGLGLWQKSKWSAAIMLGVIATLVFVGWAICKTGLV